VGTGGGARHFPRRPPSSQKSGRRAGRGAGGFSRIDYTGNHGFQNGRMRISSDGTLLFATSGGNVLGYVVAGP